MSAIYEAIGRLVVGFVRHRYRRELRMAGGVAVGAALLGVAAYAATRAPGDE